MRRVVVLALLALALPIAAWADTISLTNAYGAYTISNAGITVSGSELRSFTDNGFTINPAAPSNSIGSISFSTGALISGSTTVGAPGAVFAGGGSFDVYGRGKQYWGTPKLTVFAGSFVGPVTWNLTGQGPNGSINYQLVGSIAGMLWNGYSATGTTSQNMVTFNNGWRGGGGEVKIGYTILSTPEPGTLGLLGTGLVCIAGMFRRKLVRG